MQRRTFRRIRSASSASHHHNVYVVLLEDDAARLPQVRLANPQRDPRKPCLYVGMTGLSPAERFENHKRGLKAARVVELFGIRLLPELYEVFNPCRSKRRLKWNETLRRILGRRGLR
jgi:hypothetical protein